MRARVALHACVQYSDIAVGFVKVVCEKPSLACPVSLCVRRVKLPTGTMLALLVDLGARFVQVIG